MIIVTFIRCNLPPSTRVFSFKATSVRRKRFHSTMLENIHRVAVIGAGPAGVATAKYSSLSMYSMHGRC